MKKHCKKITFTALFFIVICPLFKLNAQNPTYDFVITQTNDTIKCHVTTSLFGVMKYRPIGSGDKSTKITHEKVKLYFLAKDSITYASVTLPDSSKDYLQVIESGRVNLYEEVKEARGPNGASATSNFWFVSKCGEPLKEIKSNGIFNDGNRASRKNYLLEMFADDSALANEFKNDNKFSFDKIKYYVKKYNINNKDKPYQKPVRPKKKPEAEPSPDFNPSNN